MDVEQILDRKEIFFEDDYQSKIDFLHDCVGNSSVLVIGAAGSIGHIITKLLFGLKPKSLHAIDLSENNLVELVRDIRSSLGYLGVDFKTFAIDVGSAEFELLLKNHESYDYVFNLSALKHVRSESDPYTLMRLMQTNIINVHKSLKLFEEIGIKRYFAVSTDKAANPVNLMGASKLIMEKVLFNGHNSFKITTARFANVAFSDGSLLNGFEKRIEKKQPLSAPSDIERYFISHLEAGKLSLLAGILGDNLQTFFPKLNELQPVKFSKIAKKYIISRGLKPIICDTEDNARAFLQNQSNDEWPLYLFNSNTSGEKDLEEFYTKKDQIVDAGLKQIGAIQNSPTQDFKRVDEFVNAINDLKKSKAWNRNDIIHLVNDLVKEFAHFDTGVFLDDKM